MTQPTGGVVRILPFAVTLRQFLKRAKTALPGERCQLCDALLSDEHRHIVERRTRRLLCTCEICGTAHEDGPYRTVPMRYVGLPRMTVSAADWDALAIPVDLAFFFFNSDLGRIVACYPGPAGAAESVLPLEAWPALVDRNPAIQALVPDVEALLVRRRDDECAAFIVPIDACYELVGRIRRAWAGFGGGSAGQGVIEEFFRSVLEKTADGPAKRTCCSAQDLEERT